MNWYEGMKCGRWQNCFLQSLHSEVNSKEVLTDYRFCQHLLRWLKQTAITSTLSDSSYPDVEVSVFIAGADAEGIVSPWRDTGGLNLEDVRGDGALGGDAHVAVDDGERQISTDGLVDRTHTAAGHAHRGVNSHSESYSNNWCRNTEVHQSASRGERREWEESSAQN